MLRVIDGGAGESTPLRLEDLPLGPWAGARVRVWATKTSVRWHADGECSSLKSRARTEEFGQPQRGTLGQRLPADLHCQPPGRLSEYLRAAQTLVRFAADTDDAEGKWDRGDIVLSAFPGRHGYLIAPGEYAELEGGALAPVWTRERERRSRWAQRVAPELALVGQRLPMMVMADWLRRGRTPLAHQPRYDQFLRLGTHELDRAEVTVSRGNDPYVNECLPEWLDDVVRGMTCETATASMVERELDRAQLADRSEDVELPRQVGEAWQRIGARWQQSLEAMVWAHPGVVLALFDRYTADIDQDLLDVCVQRGPAAHLNVGHLDWTVAVVPAICRVAFSERERGAGGLVLMDPALPGIDETFCEQFLRNLVISLQHPELADHVTGTGGDFEPVPMTELSQVEHEASVVLHQMGFGSEGWSNRLTLARCAPALRAAARGAELVV